MLLQGPSWTTCHPRSSQQILDESGLDLPIKIVDAEPPRLGLARGRSCAGLEYVHSTGRVRRHHLRASRGRRLLDTQRARSGA